METIISTIAGSIITSIITGFITWFITKGKYKHEMEMKEIEHKHELETMKQEQSNKLTDVAFKEFMKNPKAKMFFNQMIGTLIDEQNVGNLRNKK